MNLRTVCLVLLAGLGLWILPTNAAAATYMLPVSTASFAVPFDYYEEFENGEPIGPYDFCINPKTLPLGVSSDVVYESAVIFDWNELTVIPEGTIVDLSLHLSTISPPLYCGDYLMQPLFNVDHAVPRPSDFDWLSQYTGDSESGGVVSLCGFDPRVPNVPVLSGFSVYHAQEYWGWILTTAGCSAYPEIEIAGTDNDQELAAPYVLVTTVPEPSSLVGVGTALACLAGLVGAGRKRLIAGMATIAILGVLVIMAGQAFAQDEGTEMNSEPGSAGVPFEISSGIPLPGTRGLPDDFTILPAFPRLFWSFGCAPTTGAMILGYYDNAGFPHMFRNPDGSDALFPTNNYPSDNKMFLRRDTYGNLLDSVNMYPSGCALSASEMGVFGQTGYGNVNDYYYGSPFTVLTGLLLHR